MSKAVWISIMLILLAVTACTTSSTKPDLGQLYRSWASREEGRRPVVAIHGLMGARLIDAQSGDVVWGGMSGLIGGNVGSRLALPLEMEAVSNPIVANGFIKSLAGVDIYGSILQTLEKQGGYLMASSQAETALPDAQAIFICEDHRALVHNPTFQNNLLHVLLYQPISAAEACGLL